MYGNIRSSFMVGDRVHHVPHSQFGHVTYVAGRSGDRWYIVRFDEPSPIDVATDWQRIFEATAVIRPVWRVCCPDDLTPGL